LTAWSRYHHSSGFGIHSPFAYRFVRHVWRQPLHYYAYEGLHQLLGTIKSGTSRAQRRSMDLIVEREARLLFRVTNFFNPRHILQVGAATGVESVAMLEVSRESRLYLLDPQLEQKALAVRVLQSQLDRVECYDDSHVAVDEFLAASSCHDGGAMVLINVPIDPELLYRLVDGSAAVVMRNLGRDRAMRHLFETCCDHMAMGQTYSNGKIAILVANSKLQREHFDLWL